ncbi:MAG: LCP family protein [Chloroflexota bacterium]
MKLQVLRSHDETKRTDWRLRGLMFGFALFVAGGLYFGYVFVSIAFDLLELQTGADLPNLPTAPVVGQTNPNPVNAEQPLSAAPRSGERINILLLGLDQRPRDNGEASRSDTMIVASLDPRTQTAAMLSIPRDLWVSIPTMDRSVMYHKVNTAHFWGDFWKYPDGKSTGGGPLLAMRTVEYNLGIRIHYYARIDFKGFQKAIDLLGGIDINVPKEIVDTEYPAEDDVNVITVVFKPGLQRMDGKTALRYARTRHADSDFGRMERQRQVLIAVRDRALRLDILPKLPELIGTMRDAFDTDIPLDQMLSLANLGRNLKSDGIVSRAIDVSMIEPDEPIEGALLPKQREIGKLVTELFADSVLKEEAATVEVQNGTTRDGLATSTAQMLRERGFQVSRTAQADGNTYAQTQIFIYGDADYTAQQLANVLHVSPSLIHKVPKPANMDVDVRIVLGKDAETPR